MRFRPHASRKRSPSLARNKRNLIRQPSARPNLNQAENLYLLEEEVISNELLLSSLIHAVESVELAFKVTSEGATGLNDLVHDLVALLVSDTRAESIAIKVTADTNTGRSDEGGTFLRERWAVELLSVHVGDVLVGWLVTVVVLNDLVKELVEGLVGVSAASIAANAGVDVLAAGEDASLEGDTAGVLLVVVLLPDVLCEKSADRRLAVSGELRESSELLRILEVGTALGAAGSGVGDTLGRVATHG